MKKILILFLLIFNLILVGCNTNTTETETIIENQYQVDYYAMSEDYSLTDKNFLHIDEEIISLESGLFHSILLTSRGRVLTWGDNQYGQLGNQTLDAKLIPTEITEFFNLDDEETIIQISAGAVHSAALSSENRMFVWGNNDHSQLGDGTFGPFSYETKPKDITSEFSLETGNYLEKINLGTFHSAVLTSQNRLFIWGNNEKGQIGNGTNIEQALPIDITSQFIFSEGEKIKHVELGNLNSAIITTNNRLFIWGDNTYGQIGNESFIDSYEPIDITSYFELTNDEFIEKFSLGPVHSSALTSNNNLYMWGYNSDGLLGDQSTENINKPTNIMEYIVLGKNEIITDVAIGGSHSTFLTSENNFYIWGMNLYGELGNDSTDSINSPTFSTDVIPLDNNDTIKFSSLGIRNSFIVTTQGNVFAWGFNEHGELGINSNALILTPTKVYLFKPELIYSQNYNLDEEFNPYTPTRNNYEINNWYLNENLSIEFDINNFSNDNIKLFGHWSSKEELDR